MLLEALPAGVTDERTLPAVHSGVDLQVSGLREAAAAHLAAEGAVARVHESVAP